MKTTDKTHTATRKIGTIQSSKLRPLALPLIVVAGYLNMGNEDCAPPPPPITCQGQTPTHVFDSSSSEPDGVIGTEGDDVIVLFAGPGPRTVLASGGDDYICVRWSPGDSEDITIDGGPGNDVVDGSAAGETIYGGLGDDVLRGLGGDDHIEGNDGFDFLLGGAGNDVLLGGDDDDMLWGEGGDDWVLGDDGDDNVYGGAGDDWLVGGNGDDSLFNGESLTVNINGGPGYDTATICGTAFDPALLIAVEDVQYSNDPACSCQGQPATHVFESDSENPDGVIGTEGDDVIVLFAGPGPRTVLASGGDDYICVRWSPGDSEDITVNGGPGNDVVDGSAAGETIYGGLGNDVLRGLGGDDHIEGNDGFDFLLGGAGNDVLLGGDDDDMLWGEEGDDWVLGDDGDDNVYGGVGDDWLVGGNGDDVLFELLGDMTGNLNGGPGNDTATVCDGFESLDQVEQVFSSTYPTCPGEEPPSETAGLLSVRLEISTCDVSEQYGYGPGTLPNLPFWVSFGGQYFLTDLRPNQSYPSEWTKQYDILVPGTLNDIEEVTFFGDTVIYEGCISQVKLGVNNFTSASTTWLYDSGPIEAMLVPYRIPLTVATFETLRDNANWKNKNAPSILDVASTGIGYDMLEEFLEILVGTELATGGYWWDETNPVSITMGDAPNEARVQMDIGMEIPLNQNDSADVYFAIRVTCDGTTLTLVPFDFSASVSGIFQNFAEAIILDVVNRYAESFTQSIPVPTCLLFDPRFDGYGLQLD